MTAGARVGITIGLAGRTLELDRRYVDGVLAAGGMPVLLAASIADTTAALAGLDGLDGLILTGGGDVWPGTYGQRTTTTLDRLDKVRDQAEIALFHAAHDQGMRVLGICRGAQLMAVATGGRLIQDLPSEGLDGHLDVRHDRTHASLTHPIKPEPGSRAERVLGGAAAVNSHHHQAISQPGDALVASAWADDGTIEAVEGPRLLGVQWHPEVHGDEVDSFRTFRWLVDGDEGVHDEP